MEITLTVPEPLGQRLRSAEGHIPEIIEFGLREWDARHSGGFSGLAEVLETLATLPGPEEVLALRPSPALQERLDHLLEQSQAGELSAEQRREWEQYQYVEHLVRLAKTRAALALEGK